MFCFDGFVCYLLQWVVGQVVDLDRWISVSWARWWRRFGSVEIGGFMSLDRWCVCGFIGSFNGDSNGDFFFWLGLMVGFWFSLN